METRKSAIYNYWPFVLSEFMTEPYMEYLTEKCLCIVVFQGR